MEFGRRWFRGGQNNPLGVAGVRGVDGSSIIVSKLTTEKPLPQSARMKKPHDESLYEFKRDKLTAILDGIVPQ